MLDNLFLFLFSWILQGVFFFYISISVVLIFILDIFFNWMIHFEEFFFIIKMLSSMDYKINFISSIFKNIWSYVFQIIYDFLFVIIYYAPYKFNYLFFSRLISQLEERVELVSEEISNLEGVDRRATELSDR